MTRGVVNGSSSPLKHRSLSARVVFLLLLGLIPTLCLGGCHAPLYYYSEYNYAGRPTPPSGLQQRVLAVYTLNGSTGGGEILDGLRDIRSNVQNTKPSFTIAGLSVAVPNTILNFPEQQAGYILDYSSGSLTAVNYSTERSSTAVATYGANAPSVGASPDGSRFVGATATTGQIIVNSGGAAIPLNLPNVNRVVINPGNTIILAMTRNSNALYRIVQIPQSSNPVTPPGSIDCEPLLLPVYCVVPVAGNYDRPTNAYFSLDGNSVYVLNSGPENGGQTASVSVLQSTAVVASNLPAVNPLAAGAPSPLANLPVANPIPIPGGVTDAVSDGTTLYLSGQSLLSQTATGTLNPTPRTDGLFTGYLTLLNQTTYVPSNPVSISDGTHTRMLLADNDTLWIGSSQCSNGERQATGQNYNCLTMVNLGSATPTATVVPNLTPGGSTTVAYPNTNGNQYYYGDLTGLCWVQTYNKVYTAYGGQVHIFSTVDGSEINNVNVTVQGTVLDVAYMDALTNSAN